MTKNGMCFWEKVCISAGFQLVHDGQKNPGLLQQKLGVNDATFYTRKYRGFMDGKPINTWVTFVYDDREAQDIRVSYRDGKDKGEMALEELERSLHGKRRQDTGNGNEGGQQDARGESQQDAPRQAG